MIETLADEQYRAFVTTADYLVNRKDISNPLRFLSHAGCGKTYTVRALTAFLAKHNIQPVAASYVGRAAAQMAKDGLNASTLHSILYKPVLDADGNLVRWEKRNKDDVASVLIHGLIIDEASMVPRGIWNDLAELGVPIVLAGDQAQLPSISPREETPFCTLTDLPGQSIELKQIRRQSEGSGILELCQHLRENNSIPRWKRNDVVVRAKRSVMTVKHFKDNDYDAIICGMNKTRKKINENVRVAKGFNDIVPEAGETVMCLQNTVVNNTKIYNGERFKVEGRMNSLDVCQFNLSSMDSPGKKVTVRVHNTTWKTEKPHWEEPDLPIMTFGYALTAHKCVHPDTIVETDEGLLPIREITDTGMIATRDGVMGYHNKIINPPMRSLRIIGEGGYEVTVTDDHKVEYYDDDSGSFIMKEAKELKEGEWMRMKLGVTAQPNRYACLPENIESDVRAVKWDLPKECDETVAEFLGLMVADGCMFKTGFRLLKRHRDVVERFSELVYTLFGYRCEVKPSNVCSIGNGWVSEVNSTHIRSWLIAVGGMTPHEKGIPECIMRSPYSVQMSFFRGLFEDGCANIKDGVCDHIQFTTEYKSIADYVQVSLLRAGIISQKVQRETSSLWNIYIYGNGCSTFKERIGFVSKLKNSRLNHYRETEKRYRIPITREMASGLYDEGLVQQHQKVSMYKKGYISREMARSTGDSTLSEMLNWHYVRVESIEESVESSMCVTVPDGGNFLQNGFPHSNCQGSSFTDVLFIDEDVSFFLDQQKFRYTACSRASNKLTVGA